MELAARRTRQALQARRKNLSVAPRENARLAERIASPVTLAPAESASCQNEAASFNEFYDKYDALTGLVCLAAQEGVSDKRESKYQAEREWFVRVYPHAIPGIEAWESYGSDDDAEAPLFARFWTPPTLLELLQNDGGDLIEQMEKSYDVLTVWEKSLAHSASPAV